MQRVCETHSFAQFTCICFVVFYLFFFHFCCSVGLKTLSHHVEKCMLSSTIHFAYHSKLQIFILICTKLEPFICAAAQPAERTQNRMALPFYVINALILFVLSYAYRIFSRFFLFLFFFLFADAMISIWFNTFALRNKSICILLWNGLQRFKNHWFHCALYMG